MKSIFTQDSIDFLQEIKEKNSATWFAENKERYNESLIDPLRTMVNMLSATMYKIDSDFELRPLINKTISRINRDTRFSKDKSLYKDTMWITFKKIGKSNTDYPAFFLEISPYGYRYGMGFYCATSGTMGMLREHMNNNEKLILELIKQIDKEGIFQLEGDMYKKNMFTDKKSILQPWYNRKNIFLVYNGKIGELFEKTLIEKIRDDFISLTGIYKFLCSALSE